MKEDLVDHPNWYTMQRINQLKKEKQGLSTFETLSGVSECFGSHSRSRVKG
jgi:hypothetical protein